LRHSHVVKQPIRLCMDVQFYSTLHYHGHLLATATSYIHSFPMSKCSTRMLYSKQQYTWPVFIARLPPNAVTNGGQQNHISPTDLTAWIRSNAFTHIARPNYTWTGMIA
jgi:hypothetical protein